MSFILLAVDAAMQVDTLPPVSSRPADTGALAKRQDSEAA